MIYNVTDLRGLHRKEIWYKTPEKWVHEEISPKVTVSPATISELSMAKNHTYSPLGELTKATVRTLPVLMSTAVKGHPIMLFGY